ADRLARRLAGARAAGAESRELGREPRLRRRHRATRHERLARRAARARPGVAAAGRPGAYRRDDHLAPLAHRSWQRARAAQTRMLLRALYTPNQLEEHLTWFWLNHFNVFQYKGPLRALVADYEERAIRPHALGRFRE